MAERRVGFCAEWESVRSARFACGRHPELKPSVTPRSPKPPTPLGFPYEKFIQFVAKKSKALTGCLKCRNVGETAYCPGADLGRWYWAGSGELVRRSVKHGRSLVQTEATGV